MTIPATAASAAPDRIATSPIELPGPGVVVGLVGSMGVGLDDAGGIAVRVTLDGGIDGTRVLGGGTVWTGTGVGRTAVFVRVGNVEGFTVGVRRVHGTPPGHPPGDGGPVSVRRAVGVRVSLNGVGVPTGAPLQPYDREMVAC